MFSYKQDIQSCSDLPPYLSCLLHKVICRSNMAVIFLTVTDPSPKSLPATASMIHGIQNMNFHATTDCSWSSWSHCLLSFLPLLPGSNTFCFSYSYFLYDILATERKEGTDAWVCIYTCIYVDRGIHIRLKGLCKNQWHLNNTLSCFTNIFFVPIFLAVNWCCLSCRSSWAQVGHAWIL